ncbi:hypothetical protein MPEAHAMD_6554 [Methylobacterium frigidaeris]|uniref:Uncharacterized protein n=1 Tax=Methylobacterium frigidaeris TaxID=2038277 RepID=A0AA37HHS0_9HYPH|nr:hypothetical protein MPEAHAMD_6554 [Methylobacterium frigidaeris]
MGQAMSKLYPMLAHGFNEQECDAPAQVQARKLLNKLQAEGLYG